MSRRRKPAAGQGELFDPNPPPTDAAAVAPDSVWFSPSGLTVDVIGPHPRLPGHVRTKWRPTGADATYPISQFLELFRPEER